MIRIIALLVSSILFTGCTQKFQTLDSGLASLKAVKIDSATNQIFYIPLTAVLTGPGNKKQPLKMKVSDQQVIQGTLKIIAEKKDIEELKKRANNRFGNKIKVSPFLSGAYRINLSHNNKVLINTETIANNVNLPVSFTVKNGEPNELQINIIFTPYIKGGKKVKSVSNHSYKKIIRNHQQESSASGSKKLIIGNESPESFNIKQKISF